MGGEVVHHIVERLRFRESVRVAFEHPDEGLGGVIGVALEAHFSIGVMEEGEYVQGAMADVLELLQTFSHGVGLQIGRKSLEDLDAWTLIKEEQVAGWVSVEGNEVLHLGEEVGISDVKEVAGPMRLESVALQNAM
jgi:hypothetical protein